MSTSEHPPPITISADGEISYGGVPLAGLIRLVNENNRWVLWRHGAQRARARDVTPIIHDPDALQQIIRKMLTEIGIRTVEDLHGYTKREIAKKPKLR